jgi:hypothetical protein
MDGKLSCTPFMQNKNGYEMILETVPFSFHY